MHTSIIVPVYNEPEHLRECLSALLAESRSESDVIVVDDASTDQTPAVASQLGVRLFRLGKNSGPAAARNYGARHSEGDILLFVDADVVVAPGVVNRVIAVLHSNPDVAAVFGSYDSRPRAQGVVSQYRNLLHHFVHQHGRMEASTFWAGCGAIRRPVFEAVGGFDEIHAGTRFGRSMEDIELGYRLRRAGHRIVLDRSLQVTHLKQWTLSSFIRTDIISRAIPWSRLILERRQFPDDLNLGRGQRWSVALVALACVLVPLSAFHRGLLVLSGAALLGALGLNRKLFRFFWRERGLRFAAACVPLHFLHYLCSGLGFLHAWTSYLLNHRDRVRATAPSVP